MNRIRSLLKALLTQMQNTLKNFTPHCTLDTTEWESCQQHEVWYHLTFTKNKTTKTKEQQKKTIKKIKQL